jgi:tripartite-type tricarboxylate transporter receptor subunit TctC
MNALFRDARSFHQHDIFWRKPQTRRTRLVMVFHKKLRLRTFLATLVGVSFASLAAPAWAQADFPNRRINVIVPYAAGGIVDIATRIVVERVSQRLGQPITVEVKPGGNANIGTLLAASAAPDGYTWSFIGPATLANPHIYQGLAWNTNSFTGVGITAWAPFVIVVNPDSPANNVQEFIALAQKSPGSMSYGNTGIGSAMHMNTALFMQHTKTQMTMIPYTGQPQALGDLLANRIQFMIVSVGLAAQHIQEKKVKALAVVSHQRSPMLPNVPTIAELGFPAVNVVPWYGIGVPRDTPQPIAEKINVAINAVMREPEIAALFAAQSLEPVAAMNLKQIADLIARDSEEVGKVVKSADIKLAP